MTVSGWCLQMRPISRFDRKKSSLRDKEAKIPWSCPLMHVARKCAAVPGQRHASKPRAKAYQSGLRDRRETSWAV
ncbi:hypothetical protein RHECNPAF_850057 [Rhizobium etli CNPAF512]|nr:hypothetical protein RHECNPAF_850057 [Rhizobium etli CNPAF512]